MTIRRLNVLLLPLLVLAAACLSPASLGRQPVSMQDKPDWWRTAVFYQVFPRSFQDSATGPLASDGIGDIQGLIDRLDYLNDGDPKTTDDLGITAIWLTPIMPSPSYHGYDITDYRDVNKVFGSRDDFKKLVAEAHARGIRVIIDLVINHTSNKHPWFIDSTKPDSPKRDWYIWVDKDPGWKGPWGEKVWHKNGAAFYYGMFSNNMPDLNFRTQAVTTEVNDIVRYWLTEMHADGLRLDAIRHLIEDGQVQENTPETHAWLKGFYTFYKSVDKNAMAVGEVWSDSANVAKYIGDEMDLAFEFDLSFATMGAVKTGTGSKLVAELDTAQKLFPPGQYATFLTNHDQNRSMSDFGGDVAKAKLAATILLTVPGVPFIYYGEEIGMTGMKPDEKIRTPMQWTAGANAGFTTGKPWQAVNSGFEKVNVELEAKDPQSLLSHYRKMIGLRRSHAALLSGDYTKVVSTNPRVVAYLRTAPGGEAFLVVLNLADKPISDYRLTLPASSLKSVKVAHDLVQDAAAENPTLDPQGGFAKYRPILELGTRTGYVIEFIP